MMRTLLDRAPRAGRLPAHAHRLRHHRGRSSRSTGCSSTPSRWAGRASAPRRCCRTSSTSRAAPPSSPRLHLHAAARRGAPDRHAAAAVLVAGAGPGDRPGQVPVGAGLPGAVTCCATLYMPLLVLVHGKVSFGHIAAGYLGLLLLGSASLAIGTFGSALARNQVLAAILSGCMLVALLILCWLLARITEQPLVGRVQRAGAVEPALPAVPGGRGPPARRRLLPAASPTWRCSRPPGCSRRGGGDEPAGRRRLGSPRRVRSWRGSCSRLPRRAHGRARARRALALGGAGRWRWLVLAAAWRAARMVAGPGDGRTLERWAARRSTCVGLVALAALLRPVGRWGRLARRAAVARLARAGGHAGGALPGAAGARAACRSCWWRLAAAAMARAPVLETGAGAQRAVLGAGAGLRARLRLREHVRGHAGGRDVGPGVLPHRAAGRCHAPAGARPHRAAGGDALLPARQRRGRGGGAVLPRAGARVRQLRVEALDQAVEPARAKALGVSEQRLGGALRGARARRGCTVGSGRWIARAGAAAAAGRGGAAAAAAWWRGRSACVLPHGGPWRARRDTAATCREKRRVRRCRSSRSCCARRTWRCARSRLAEGLGTEVPRDAAVVAVLGPDARASSRRRSPRCARTWSAGGRLWLALEPEGPALRAAAGAPGARSRCACRWRTSSSSCRIDAPAQRPGQPGTASFSSHPPSPTLAALGSGAAVVFAGRGGARARATASGRRVA